MIFTIISVIPIFLFVKALPNQFDQDSIKNQSFEIPTKIIDEHRQFIWGFSVKKLLKNLYLDMVRIHQTLLKEVKKLLVMNLLVICHLFQVIRIIFY